MTHGQNSIQGVRALLVALCMLVSGAGYASDAGYVGLRLARTFDLDINRSAFPADPNARLKLFGGPGMSQYLSFEGHASPLAATGRADYSPLTDPAFGVRILGLSAVGRYAITSDFSLRGRFGLVSIRNREGFDTTGLKVGGTSSGIKPFMGVGLEYRLTPALTMRGGWDYYSMREGNRLRQLSIDLNYGF